MKVITVQSQFLGSVLPCDCGLFIYISINPLTFYMPEWQREKSLENLQTMENKNTLLTFASLVFSPHLGNYVLHKFKVFKHSVESCCKLNKIGVFFCLKKSLNEYYSATSNTTTWSGKPLCGNVETLFFWLIQFCNRIQIYAWSKHISILPRIKKNTFWHIEKELKIDYSSMFLSIWGNDETTL